MTTSTPSIPIDSEILGELYLRAGPKTDVVTWVNRILYDYLERTEDEGGWNEEYYEYVTERRWNDSKINEFGDPQKGYYWTPIFLPNGTEISMEYGGAKHYAIVKHEKIDFQGNEYTPSRLASVIANGTSRNAWRDLLIRKPGESKWLLADLLRKSDR